MHFGFPKNPADSPLLVLSSELRALSGLQDAQSVSAAPSPDAVGYQASLDFVILQRLVLGYV
jgi:hypothetical protein